VVWVWGGGVVGKYIYAFKTSKQSSSVGVGGWGWGCVLVLGISGGIPGMCQVVETKRERHIKLGQHQLPQCVHHLLDSVVPRGSLSPSGQWLCV